MKLLGALLVAALAQGGLFEMYHLGYVGLLWLVAIEAFVVPASLVGVGSLGKPFYRHDWRLVWIMGNVWTECRTCGERRQIPPEDLSEMPPGTKIDER